MKVYEPKNIRNIVLAGHAGSGKTTLSEDMLFISGMINRKGIVEDNNTQSDFHDIEHERTCSVYASPVFLEWKDFKFNVIDTPGYDDYIGEMYSGIYAADLVVVCVNAQNGSEVCTENAWVFAQNTSKPVMFIINKLDIEQAKYQESLEDLQSLYGNSVTAFQYPLNPKVGFNSIIDIYSMKMYKYSGDGKYEVLDIPDSEKDKATALRNELIESVAESDENLMNSYFEEGDLTEEQLNSGLKRALINREIYPVFCAASKSGIGSQPIMQFIKDVAPAPFELPMPVEEGSIKVDCDPASKTSLLVFKMFSDARLGDMTYFKVKSGKLSQSMDLVNENRGTSERMGQLFCIQGKKREEVTELLAGDIGATVKLKNTHINDTLHEKGFNVHFTPIKFPNPKIRTAIAPKTKGEEEKLGLALNNLHEEDPTIIIEHSQELRQTIIHAQGELHLTSMLWRLENRYKVLAQLLPPRVQYRETIQKTAKGSYRHKKQSGGAGQFAEVHMMIEPWYEDMPNPPALNVKGKDVHDLNWGGKLEFLNCIVGGVIDMRFLPAILKGVMEKMEEGPLTGSYVRDIRIAIFDGKMHPVDSNEAAFKTAAMMVFKDIFTQASPMILEPIYEVEVRIPEEFVGDVMSDLPSRRGLILGIDSEGRYQKVKARMPLAELDKYSTALRSMTQAKGSYTAQYIEYQNVPSNVQQELIDAYKKSQSEDDE